MLLVLHQVVASDEHLQRVREVLITCNRQGVHAHRPSVAPTIHGHTFTTYRLQVCTSIYLQIRSGGGAGGAGQLLKKGDASPEEQVGWEGAAAMHSLAISGVALWSTGCHQQMPGNCHQWHC
jgi:hypothetical protein